MQAGSVLAPAAPAAGPAAQARAETAAAREFEAMFLGEMLAPMFANLARDPLFGSSGEDVWHSLLVQEYGRALAARGGLGLGQSMMRQLLATQEVT